MTRQHDSHSKPQGRQAPISDTTILKISKEVVVKFIEVGRLSPANFAATFDDIYSAVRESVKKHGG